MITAYELLAEPMRDELPRLPMPFPPPMLPKPPRAAPDTNETRMSARGKEMKRKQDDEKESSEILRLPIRRKKG